MKTFYYLVGITQENTDFYYPVMDMLGGFFSSDYAHSPRMYTDKSPFKVIANPVDDKVFAATPDGRFLHMFKLEGSNTFIEHMEKYLFEGHAWENKDVKPYLKFCRNEKGEIVPIEWFDDKFKNYLGILS